MKNNDNPAITPQNAKAIIEFFKARNNQDAQLWQIWQATPDLTLPQIKVLVEHMMKQGVIEKDRAWVEGHRYDRHGEWNVYYLSALALNYLSALALKGKIAGL